MNDTIEFDKEIYYPGDVVTATFKISEPPKEVRKITLSLESGEYTEAGFQSTISVYTVMDHHYYSYAEHEVRGVTGTQEFKVRFKLDSEYHQPIDISRLNIFHRAHIRYNIPYGVDKHVYKQIPYQISVDMTPRQVTRKDQDTSVSISHNIVSPGNTVVVQVKREKSFRLRGIMVEFEGNLITRAQGEKETTSLIFESYKYDDLSQFPVNISIPPGLYSSSEGVNHQLVYTIRVIFDIRFGKNVVINVPLQIYNEEPPLLAKIET